MLNTSIWATEIAYLLCSNLYQWGNWSLERVCNSSKVMELDSKINAESRGENRGISPSKSWDATCVTGTSPENTLDPQQRSGPVKSNASVQFSRSVVSDSLRTHEPQACQASHIHWVGDTIQPSHPLSSLLLLPSIFPSIGIFSDESALCIRWPKYWSFSFNISPSDEHTGLISFRMDWLDLHVVQGTLKSFVQHHSSKASILQRSTFFIV